MYYNGKTLKEDDPESAIEQFKAIIEKDDPEWSYKATKQTIKVLLMTKKYEEALQYYQKMLAFGSVPRSQAEKSLNNILDRMASADNLEFLQRVYAMTLDALEKSNNERLWIKTGLKLMKLYVEREDVELAEKMSKKLHYKFDSATEMGTYLLELYSLDIQLCTITNNNKKLKQLYHKTLNITTAIPHPRILGVIRECGGKMHMREHQWDSAREDFFESFKNYDEAGSLQRIQVLKYYVLACMLSESKINPFASQETKPYMNNPNIQVMVNFVEAFQNSDVDEFNRLMKTQGHELTGDKFMRLFMNDVIRIIQIQGLVELVKPFSRVSIDHLASQLKISNDEVHSILRTMILDGQIPGARINDIENYIEMNYNQLEPQPASEVLPDRYRSNVAAEKQQKEQQSVVNTTSEESAEMHLLTDRSEVLTKLAVNTHKLHTAVHAAG